MYYCVLVICKDDAGFFVRVLDNEKQQVVQSQLADFSGELLSAKVVFDDAWGEGKDFNEAYTQATEEACKEGRSRGIEKIHGLHSY